MLTMAEHGGDDSPSKHPTAPPSRLHNFNIKSWGTQRHLRSCTSLKAQKRRNHREKDKGRMEGDEVSAPSLAIIKENEEIRKRFSVSLTKEEIEEDIYAMKGTRPSRRPKKRPRAIQRQIDTLFPGCCLSEITLDTYKVVE